jgi:hypothetical protein
MKKEQDSSLAQSWQTGIQMDGGSTHLKWLLNELDLPYRYWYISDSLLLCLYVICMLL